MKPLTPLLLDYLRRAAAGEPQYETARELWVSFSTVKFNRARVIRQLGARNMTHAVAVAYERGLLP